LPSSQHKFTQVTVGVVDTKDWVALELGKFVRTPGLTHTSPRVAVCSLSIRAKDSSLDFEISSWTANYPVRREQHCYDSKVRTFLNDGNAAEQLAVVDPDFGTCVNVSDGEKVEIMYVSKTTELGSYTAVCSTASNASKLPMAWPSDPGYVLLVQTLKQAVIHKDCTSEMPPWGVATAEPQPMARQDDSRRKADARIFYTDVRKVMLKSKLVDSMPQSPRWTIPTEPCFRFKPLTTPERSAVLGKDPHDVLLDEEEENEKKKKAIRMRKSTEAAATTTPASGLPKRAIVPSFGGGGGRKRPALKPSGGGSSRNGLTGFKLPTAKKLALTPTPTDGDTVVPSTNRPVAVSAVSTSTSAPAISTASATATAAVASANIVSTNPVRSAVTSAGHGAVSSRLSFGGIDGATTTPSFRPTSTASTATTSSASATQPAKPKKARVPRKVVPTAELVAQVEEKILEGKLKIASKDALKAWLASKQWPEYMTSTKKSGLKKGDLLAMTVLALAAPTIQAATNV
jgi:hypothetical protein